MNARTRSRPRPPVYFFLLHQGLQRQSFFLSSVCGQYFLNLFLCTSPHVQNRTNLCQTINSAFGGDRHFLGKGTTANGRGNENLAGGQLLQGGKTILGEGEGRTHQSSCSHPNHARDVVLLWNKHVLISLLSSW